MQRIRVFLVDDHTLVRAGLRALLEATPDIDVVGEAGNGREALARVTDASPHVILLDIMMPEHNGLDTLPRLAALDPPVRTIVLSMNSAEEYVVEALRRGASGYLIKAGNAGELETAIRTVAQGGTFLSPAVAHHVVRGLVRGETAGVRLTPRQREVLQLLAEGFSTKQAASRLGISPKTVEAHRSQIMESLNIHDVPGLVRYAIRTGLTTADR